MIFPENSKINNFNILSHPNYRKLTAIVRVNIRILITIYSIFLKVPFPAFSQPHRNASVLSIDHQIYYLFLGPQNFELPKTHMKRGGSQGSILFLDYYNVNCS